MYLAVGEDLVLEHGLDLSVQDEHESGTDGTECICTSALEQSSGSFFCDDRGEAVHGALVLPFFRGLLTLHLQAAAHGIKGVGHVSSGNSSGLRANKLGGEATSGSLLLVGVQANKGVVNAKVGTTEGYDTDYRYAKPVVERKEALGATGSLGEAVDEAVELLFATTYVGSKAGTSVVKGVYNAEGACACETARRNVDCNNLAKLGFFCHTWGTMP